MATIQSETPGAFSAPSLDQRRRGAATANVGRAERWLSAVVGGALMVVGLKRGARQGWLPAVVGGSLFYRGVSGHSPLYRALGIDTSDTRPRSAVSVPHGRGVKIERSVIIEKPAEELYSIWRNFENLPRFMSHVIAVRQRSETTSHWVMRSVGGAEVSWDAEIINETPNELIAWRTVEGSDVDHAGSVRFEPMGAGTRVKVTLEYRPPAGKIGVGLARLLGQQPELVIEEDLRRFRQGVEAGEVVSVAGQPRGAV